jgi:site-specific recombinase XerD
MNASNHPAASDLPIEQLVAHALGELKKLDYSRRTLRRYRTVWQHLAAFTRQADLGDKYSKALAGRFVDAYQIRIGERLTAQTGWRRHVAFGVKVLGDFACDGRVERPFLYTENLRIPPSMTKALRDYEQYGRDQRHLRASSLRERMRTIGVFLDYLGSRKVAALDRMQPNDITTFVTSQGHRSPRAASRSVSDLRCFLRFLLQRGILHRDVSQVLPTVRVPRDATIPSVWDPELVVRLLKVVDRSSPRGKRDYAILLLACRLGLRLGDIRTLRLDDLKWDTASLEITQSKTGAPLCLPMTEEVGEALIDYLKLGRPQTAYREVFLKARLPFTPIPEDTRLHHVVSYWRELAGIRFRSKQHCGLHSLRHTLATELLRKETPLHVISEILGHATTASTMIYAKADVEALRGAALNTEEVRHGA